MTYKWPSHVIFHFFMRKPDWILLDRFLALGNDIEHQVSRPSLTEDEWEAHITSMIFPAVTYFNERFNEGGDRHAYIRSFYCQRYFKFWCNCGKGFISGYTKLRTHAPAKFIASIVCRNPIPDFTSTEVENRFMNRSGFISCSSIYVQPWQEWPHPVISSVAPPLPILSCIIITTW